MKGRNLIELVALWDFAGPEGSPTQVGRGLIKRGTIFSTTKDRSRALISAGKARPLIPIPHQERPGPERKEVDGPETFKYEDLNAIQVMELVEEGKLTLTQAKELETESPNPRKTLLAKIDKLMGE